MKQRGGRDGKQSDTVKQEAKSGLKLEHLTEDRNVCLAETCLKCLAKGEDRLKPGKRCQPQTDTGHDLVGGSAVSVASRLEMPQRALRFFSLLHLLTRATL